MERLETFSRFVSYNDFSVQLVFGPAIPSRNNASVLMTDKSLFERNIEDE